MVYTIADIKDNKITVDDLAKEIVKTYEEAHDLSDLDFLINTNITSDSTKLMFKISKNGKPKLKHDNIPHKIKSFAVNWNKKVIEGYHAGEIHPNNGSIRVNCYNPECTACKNNNRGTSWDLSLKDNATQKIHFEKISDNDVYSKLIPKLKAKQSKITELMTYEKIFNEPNGHTSSFSNFLSAKAVIERELKNN